MPKAFTPTLHTQLNSPMPRFLAFLSDSIYTWENNPEPEFFKINIKVWYGGRWPLKQVSHVISKLFLITLVFFFNNFNTVNITDRIALAWAGDNRPSL